MKKKFIVIYKNTFCCQPWDSFGKFFVVVSRRSCNHSSAVEYLMREEESDEVNSPAIALWDHPHREKERSECYNVYICPHVYILIIIIFLLMLKSIYYIFLIFSTKSLLIDKNVRKPFETIFQIEVYLASKGGKYEASTLTDDPSYKYSERAFSSVPIIYLI